MKFHVVQGRQILADAPDRDGTGGLARYIATVAGEPLVLLDATLERGASLIEG